LIIDIVVYTDNCAMTTADCGT